MALFQPRLVLFENVIGMLQSLPGTLSEMFRQESGGAAEAASRPPAAPQTRGKDAAREALVLRRAPPGSAQCCLGKRPRGACEEEDLSPPAKRRLGQDGAGGSRPAEERYVMREPKPAKKQQKGPSVPAPFARFWLQRFVELAYSVKLCVLAAASFGAAQTRGRVFFMASRFGARLSPLALARQ